MRRQRPGWGAVSAQLAFPTQLSSCGCPGGPGRLAGRTKAPGCRAHHGARASLSGSSKPAMSGSSVTTSINLKSSGGWGPGPGHALCSGAPLSGGRCSSPGGVAGAPNGQERGQEAGGGAGRAERCRVDESSTSTRS